MNAVPLLTACEKSLALLESQCLVLKLIRPKGFLLYCHLANILSVKTILIQGFSLFFLELFPSSWIIFLPLFLLHPYVSHWHVNIVVVSYHV